MRIIALLAMFVGMGILAAQEPAPKDNPPSKGDRPLDGKKGPFGKGGERGGPLNWKKLVETNDKDKDGFLSKDELSGGRNMWDRWKKADVDMDGKLSEKEFNDYQKQLMEKFKGARGSRRGEEKKKD